MARLPPFFALRALEAAARRRSYSRAAEELSVTHGAISQQLRKLEGELGSRLFTRQGNAMTPTPAAERLAGEVARALNILGAAVSEFTNAAERSPLVVSLEPQFGTRWLPPRLPRLLADPAGANIEFRVEARTADFVSDGVDVGVRYGRGDLIPAEVERVLLFRETLFPVCSPGLATRMDIQTPADLLTAPLLRHTRHRWAPWFAAFGLEEPKDEGLEFEDSLMLLESAAQGLGIALGRASLVQQDLASGRLVRLLPNAVISDYGFNICWRADNPKLRRIEALRDWLLAEVSTPT